MYCTEYSAPIGRLLLASDGIAITDLHIDLSAPGDAQSCPVLEQAILWLDAYFYGKSHPIDFSLSPKGTPFQQRVWEALRNIPFGTTCTYGDIAREIGCRSPQAVGQAVGGNPIAIMIPCHRVVGSKGQLTGYAWGIEKKKWLLEHEK